MRPLAIMQWLWLGLLLWYAAPASSETDCKGLLQEYYQYTTKEPAPYTGDNMVYFLHIPRTAGRTFFTCLLRIGTPGSRRCPKAYDHLRINTEVPKCQMLSSHDDYSVVEKLPPNTAVITQLRDPVDRVLSAYEFAIEVAARQLRRTKKYVKPKNRVITDDVWPWSYLIPFFTEDIRPKLSKARAVPIKAPGVWSEQRTDDGRRYYWNKYTNTSKWLLDEEEKKNLVPNLDPYNNEIVMPLLDFIKHPITSELLHNGELLQVLGLTNYSHWPQAGEMRACMLKHDDIAEELLQFGLKRIERFAHVGAIDKLNPSAESAAAALDMPLTGPAFGAGEAPSADVEKARALSWKDAMQAGAAPVPPSLDDVYVSSGSKADVHQLASSVREKRGIVALLQQRWNQLVKMIPTLLTGYWLMQNNGGQTELRELRGELNAARAELTLAQGDLVSARTEEARKRELRAAEAKEDKKMDMSLGVEYQRCAKRAYSRNKSRKKSSMLNLRLNDYRQIYFDKEDRRAIPAEVIEEIRKLNSLDVRLHQRGLELLEEKRQQFAAQGQLQFLPNVTAVEEPTTKSGRSKNDEL